MDIQNRLVNFYKNNQFAQNYLKGIDPRTNEVILGLNGETKRVSIDVLENMKSEEDLIQFIQGKPVINTPTVNDLPQFNIEPPVSNTVENSVITPVAQEQTMLADTPTNLSESLNDIKILFELKNKDGLDNVLKKFAVNESTGLIDINKAISIITRNTMDEVEKAIKNNYEFSNDFSQYDTNGKFIGTPIIGTSTEDEKIVSSFKNIKLYLDASKMYPEQANYNEEQISNFMKTYIAKVKEELGGGTVPAAAPVENKVQEVNNIPTPPVSTTNDVPANASAGFADIFVLTVIVLVYAVIIVNLILKLN